MARAANAVSATETVRNIERSVDLERLRRVVKETIAAETVATKAVHRSEELSHELDAMAAQIPSPALTVEALAMHLEIARNFAGHLPDGALSGLTPDAEVHLDRSEVGLARLIKATEEFLEAQRI